MRVPLVSGACYVNAHRYQTCKRNRNGLISFSEVSRVLSYWRFRKTERDELLRSLEESGKIRIVNFRGITIVEEVKP